MEIKIMMIPVLVLQTIYKSETKYSPNFPVLVSLIPEEWQVAIPDSPNPQRIKIAGELTSLIKTQPPTKFA